MFEKMVSGMCKQFTLGGALFTSLTFGLIDLGEITRNILLYLIDSSLLFEGHSSEVLNTHYGFDTSFVSGIEGITSPEEVTQLIIKELKVDPKHITDKCPEIVQWAVRMVADRACKLAACAIAAIVLHTGNDKAPEGEKDKGVDVGVDGSVAQFLPMFNERVMAGLKAILGEKGAARVNIGLAKDGSGVGGKCSRGLDFFLLLCKSSRLRENAAALTALQAKKALDRRSDRSTPYVPGKRAP